MPDQPPQTEPAPPLPKASPRRNQNVYSYDTYAVFQTTLEQKRDFIVEEMMGAATCLATRKFQTTFMTIPRKTSKAYQARPATRAFDEIRGLKTEKAISAKFVSN